MTHRKAVLLMVAVTLMWSIAGVVSRFFESARGFEVTFWRSAFNALAQFTPQQREGGVPKYLGAISEGSDRAYALGIGALKIFETPIAPNELIPDFTPPQSYCYVPRERQLALF